jgi:glycerol-3-phosphate O-acyltransferase/dihydroxyacetone phosphate acyltransferase
MEVYRETRQRVSFLIAAKSMKRKAIGFFAKLMSCSTFIRCFPLYRMHHCLTVSEVPVVRAADYASPGTGKIRLSPDDPCTVLGEGTKFLSEFAPRMQILLQRSVGSPIAEVIQVISDTELKIKREFGGENGKGTSRIREKTDELRTQGVDGMDFKRLPFVDQQETFRRVYQRLTEGGYVGIFPEGL